MFEDAVAFGRAVGGNKPGGDFGFGGQADEIEMGPAQPGGGVGWGRGSNADALQGVADEGVDRMVWVGSSGRWWTLGWDEGPVDEHAWDFLGGSEGSVGDPTAEGFDFGSLKWRPVVGHPFDLRMGSVQDLYQQAFRGFSGDDGGSGFSAFPGTCCGI